MLTPRNLRTMWLAMAACGALLVAYAIWLPVPDGYDLTGPFAVAGMLLIVVGAVLGAHAQRAVNAEKRLRSGADVVARWRVDAATWERYSAFDAARAPVALNEIWLPSKTPADGVEIVVGARHVLVGHCLAAFEDPLVKINLLCLIELPSDPPCLELVAHSTGRGGRAFFIRLPLPEAARAQTERAIAHLRDRAQPDGAAVAQARYCYDLGANVPRGLEQTVAPAPAGWISRNRLQVRGWGCTTAIFIPFLGVQFGSMVGDSIGPGGGLVTMAGALAFGIVLGMAVLLVTRAPRRPG